MAVRSRPVFSVVLVLTLLLSSLGMRTPLAAGEQASPGRQAFAVYTAPGEQQYVQRDPNTLAELDDSEMLEFESAFPSWLISADGSTMVLTEDMNRETIIVFDGFEGRERLRISTPGVQGLMGLSRDGTRLVAYGSTACVTLGCVTPAWTVFDLRTGRVISRITGNPGGFGEPLVDGLAERMYQPVFLDDDDPAGPWPFQIVAYDLTSGAEVARLTLPGVKGGMWGADWVDEVPIFNQDDPAVALSPDGSRLAVIDPVTEQLTLIEATSLTVETTRSLSRTEGIGQRFWQWLGIAPRTAHAKLMVGRQLAAIFTPDGDHLYLWGTETEVGDAMDDIDFRGLGLQLIDVNSGEIVTEALDGLTVESVAPAPDNETVYVSGVEAQSEGYYGATHLWRLEADTLTTLAARQLNYTGRLAVAQLALPGEVQ